MHYRFVGFIVVGNKEVAFLQYYANLVLSCLERRRVLKPCLARLSLLSRASVGCRFLLVVFIVASWSLAHEPFVCFKRSDSQEGWPAALVCSLGGQSTDTWLPTQPSCQSPHLSLSTWAKRRCLFCKEGVKLLKCQLWQISLVTCDYALCSQPCATASRIQSQRRCYLSSLTDVQQLLKDRCGNTTSIPTLNSCHPRHPKGRVP